MNKPICLACLNSFLKDHREDKHIAGSYVYHTRDIPKKKRRKLHVCPHHINGDGGEGFVIHEYDKTPPWWCQRKLEHILKDAQDA